jgi:hypothetical protein
MSCIFPFSKNSIVDFVKSKLDFTLNEKTSIWDDTRNETRGKRRGEEKRRERGDRGGERGGGREEKEGGS